MFEIVIDTGGTFTDAVLMETGGEISTAKFPTDPADPSMSIIGSIGVLAQQRKITTSDLLAETSMWSLGPRFPQTASWKKKEPNAA